jgi:hypothetical protein
MQKFILSCLSLIMVAACTTTPANDLLDSENQQSVNLQNGAESSETLPPGKARVRFVLDGLTFNTSPMTKTDPVGLTDAGVNYLYIYEGEELLLMQTAGEAGVEFGSPSLVLDYGEHTLTFVASDFELDDTDNQVRSGNTFSARKTVTVNENTPQQSVTMARIKAGIRLVINDTDLSRVGQITVMLENPYLSLPAGGHLAINPQTNIYIPFSLPEARPATVTVYTFCPSLTEVFNQFVTLVIKDKDTNNMLSFKRVQVPLLMNRITEVRGTWLTTGTLVTVDTGWGEELVIDN